MSLSLVKVEQVRQAVVKTARLLARDKVEVRQRGGQPHVKYKSDGSVQYVNLPMIPESPSEEFLQAVQGFLDHEIAHVLFTNNKEFTRLSKQAEAEGINPKLLHSFANAFEDVRIEKFMSKKFRGSAYNLNRSLEFVLERIMEPRIKEALKIEDETERLKQILPNAFVAWCRAAAGDETAKAFMREFDLAPYFKKLEEHFPDFEERIKALETSEDVGRLAYNFVKAIQPPSPPPPPSGSGDEEGEGEGGEGEPTVKKGKSSSKGEKSKSTSSGKRGKDEAPEEEKGESDHGDDDTEEGDERGEEPDAGEKDGDAGGSGDDGDPEDKEDDEDGDDGKGDDQDADEEDEDDGAGDGEDGEDEEDGDDDGAGSDGDDEEGEDDDADGDSEGEDGLDEETRELLRASMGDMEDMDGMLSTALTKLLPGEFSGEVYIELTRDNDRVELIKADDKADVDELEGAVQRVSATMQKDLQRIITARSQSVMVPGFRSGRINPAALHRLEAFDDRVFRRKKENTSKDVAVQLVVDCSGSMNGKSAGKKKIDLAIESAWAFSQVLDKLNINNEVIGFTTSRKQFDGAYHKTQEEAYEFAKTIGASPAAVRWEELYMPIFKEFGERFTLDVKRRFATAYADHWQNNTLLQNVDGASILVAAMRLLAQKQKRKLMIVFSDGSPAAHMDPYCLQEHLRKAVQTCEVNGIETIGIGIMDDNVTNYYPKNFVVHHLEDLPGKVMGELREFLTR